MGLTEGTRADRVQAVAWVQDAKGRLVALAQFQCIP